MVREILVVNRNTLFDKDTFQGFLSADKKDFLPAVLKNFEYKERNTDLENNPDYQQIIPYVWILNPKKKEVFLYLRSKEGDENRLHNKYSGGVGGHIDKETEFNSENPINDAMMRELKEEVLLNKYPIPKIVGYLNDDSNPVGQVHFGIVAIAETEEDVKPKMHMSQGRFSTINEIEQIFSSPENEIETWTKMSWPHIKRYLENNKNIIPIEKTSESEAIKKPSLEDLKNSILEIFVTSATDHVYAIKSEVPPEVFGAFGSYFSRNPKDFREHLWNAITGHIEGEESTIKEKDLRWFAKKTFKLPSHFIEQGLSKSQDFFRKWYGKYSHKSIANTVWIPIVATNVSQLFARELAYDQLAFFIEQSTRYVKFDIEKMYLDPEIMNSKHAQVYKSTLKFLADSYERFNEIAVEFYKGEVPFNKWLELQDLDTLRLSEKELSTKYEREIKGKALDVARFLLPQAIKTNIAYILDARSTEYDIGAWKGHPLQEIREITNLIEKNAGMIAPSLLKHTDKNPYYEEKLNLYNNKLKSNPAQGFKKGVSIISYDQDSLDKAIAHLLHRYNFGGSYEQRYRESKRLSFKEKIDILKNITEKKGKFDEWIETDEEFDLVKITFEIRSDIGAIRDLRRHQKWDRGEPLYTLENGYHKPRIISRMPIEASVIFDEAIKTALRAEIEIKRDFPFQAQYVIPMAANHAIVMSSGLDQLQYLIWTRSTPQGNFSYREDAFNLAEEACKVLPWLLGYQFYPNNKDFEQVYKEAPLRTIIRIQGWEEGMHE